MKVLRKTLSLLLCVVLALGMLNAAAYAQRELSFETALAEDLKVLGLFKGVSENDFDLESAPTRTQALVMLIRLMGVESQALGRDWEQPFSDVEQWADKYVGFAYANGLTKGVSEDTFGGNEQASCEMFLTYVLRALGYSDTQGDFEWNAPFALAERCGILPERIAKDCFIRADAVMVCYAALPAKLKNTDEFLWQKLSAQGAFDPMAYAACIDQYAFYPRSSLSRDTYTEAYNAVKGQEGFVEEKSLYPQEYGCVIFGRLNGEEKLYAVYFSSTTGSSYHNNPTSLGAGRVVELPIPELSTDGLVNADAVSLSGKLGHENGVSYCFSLSQQQTGSNGSVYEAGRYEYYYALESGKLTLRFTSSDGGRTYEKSFDLVKN